MADFFKLKRGDTSPAMRRVLADEDGVAINITGATVVFNMRAAGGAVVVDGAAAVVTDAAGGEVRYDWQAGDTAEAGDFEGEFQITYLSGAVETVPNDGHIQIKITGDIA